MNIDLVAESIYLSAFFVGLFGGVHCVGMCGGIVGALSLGGQQPGIKSQQNTLLFLLAYNMGRMGSYVLAGVLVGGLGWLAANMLALHQAQRVLFVLAGLFMIAMGFYLAGWWRGLARIEQAGGVIWKRIEPLGRSMIPVRTPVQALLLGMIWGWLPCGLVYSVLIWAVASGGAQEGGLLMLSFALGTLPNLLLMGVFAARLSRFVANPIVRNFAGSMVVLFGLLMLYRAVLGEGI
ncbi:MAG: sulfite exporter TauE/SafE family protein [Gammaproteobacteria bacterium]|nr:sulfite exporter TauE/SafE family protein [Gammaproteobacteria bacterium]